MPFQPILSPEAVATFNGFPDYLKDAIWDHVEKLCESPAK